MSIRKVVLDPEKQKRLDEKNKNKKSTYQQVDMKNKSIPQADIDMLVLDRYEKESEQ